MTTEPGNKSAVVEFAKAYPVEGLAGASRTLAIEEQGSRHLDRRVRVHRCAAQQIEEAFVTWGEVVAHGPTASVHCGKHTLRMAIEEPVGARFAVESLDEACRTNHREGILKRLTFVVPAAAQSTGAGEDDG